MITIEGSGRSGERSLGFRFADVHPKAKLDISFQRTLRVPQDGDSYPLPAGFGGLPLKHIEDYADEFSDTDLSRGGVLMPMYQSEATWLNFSGDYPMAIKVATGKINAVTGQAWSNKLNGDPQDYVVTPDQDWLDGFCVEKGKVRQFVAQPLGAGETVEEILTGKSDFGGIQILVMPMKLSEYIKRFETVPTSRRDESFDDVLYMRAPELKCMSASMGIAAGGFIEQEIYEDEVGIEVWDTSAAVRCFVHVVNSQQYESITGEATPHRPITKEQYLERAIPWFSHYKDGTSLSGGAFEALGKSSVVSSGMF
jgi:hypothetical protein